MGKRFCWCNRKALKRIGVYFVLLALLAGLVYAVFLRMPGKSYRGPLPPLTDAQRTIAQQLRDDVTALATTIGERNVYRPGTLDRSADYLTGRFEALGYTVQRVSYTAEHGAQNTGPRFAAAECHNLIAELPGATRGDEVVIIGAHYDSVLGSPGANDNAASVAVVLAIAEALHGRTLDRTVRLVAFVNEEPPFFMTDQQGSLVYARRCRQRGDNVVAMLALEGLGCYSDEPNTQQYPPPLSFVYPSTGNFVGFVGNLRSRGLVRDAIASFRKHAQFPSEGGALPGQIEGVGWSDHWSFWQCGYRGIMVTDSLPFRDVHYHQPTDTADRLDYDRMARVAEGLAAVVADLASVN